MTAPKVIRAAIAPARAAAFSILLKVATSDAHSDELLRAPAVDALSPQDRSLATTLVLGTLRWAFPLDARIRTLLARPDTQLAPPVEAALFLGAFQLLHLDRIPAHAAIGESVELVKQAGEVRAAGMVNAVLRNLIRRGAHTAAVHEPESAHPRWMVERWARAYGHDAAHRICAANQQPAAVSLRLLHPEAERMLAEDGVELAAGEFLASVRRMMRGDVVRSEALRNGWIRIQDEGSQLVAELAGHGANILDVCAAPGGKTAILMERNPEAAVTAMDASRRRLDAMRRNFSGSRVEFAVQDAVAMELAPVYDLILCDVPCTGTGTLGRNPEIRFRLDEADIARHHERQVKILSRALEGLASGGRLLYSTCSLEPEENEDVLGECLARLSGFAAIPLDAEVERLEREGVIHAQGAARLRQSALRAGCLRTLPGVHGCDGFYAALIVRR